nr:DNA-3-methyladenine glycosylase [Segniliparus rotundus]
MDIRASLAAHPVAVARRILGAQIVCRDASARIVEVEAYGSDPAGLWPDPAAHSYPGPTPRNRIMFGPAGRLYVYRSMGLHVCANVVTGPEGCGSGVLIRSGEIISGHQGVQARRRGIADPVRWARGPGNFGQALGVTLADAGADLLDPNSPLRLQFGEPVPDDQISTGPRVGISKAAARPWRLWISDSKAVSPFRPGGRKKRAASFEKIDS